MTLNEGKLLYKYNNIKYYYIAKLKIITEGNMKYFLGFLLVLVLLCIVPNISSLEDDSERLVKGNSTFNLIKRWGQFTQESIT